MTNKKTTTKLPDVELATKDWVLKEMKDTENRIEKAFHDQTKHLGQKTDLIQAAFSEQTQFLGQKHEDLKSEMVIQTRWMVGLMLTMTIAILVAVLFN